MYVGRVLQTVVRAVPPKMIPGHCFPEALSDNFLKTTTTFNIKSYYLSGLQAKGLSHLSEKDQAQGPGGGKPPVDTGKLMAQIKQFMGQGKAVFKKVEMSQIGAAPAPMYALTMVGLVPICLPTLLFIVTGYVHSLGNLQLTFSSIVTGFMGGVSWASSSSREAASYTHVIWTMVPPSAGLFAILLPSFMGIPVLIAGVTASCIYELTTLQFPPWYSAIRLLLTFSIVAFLSMTWLIRLISWK